MKNHPFNKYIYMGLTAISVITAAILIRVPVPGEGGGRSGL